MQASVRRLVLASLAAFPKGTAAISSSIFVSPEKDLVFSLNIPNDTASSSLYFSIAFSAQTAWAAVGLGASKMEGNPLVLMAYPSASGENVTISPRRCYGHNEPVYDPDINVEALPGTGLFNDTTFIFNGLCSNCRSWPGNGKIDTSSTAQKMSYATGGSSDTRSNNPRQSVKVHWSYGSFTMDLVQATGAGGVPEIPTNSNITSVGAAVQSAESGYVDKKAIIHAVFMILTFVGLWPFGILVLRVGGSVRWHGISQAVAFGFAFIGSILGFVISASYNRSKKFNTAHQVIGIFVFIFAIAQITIGYLHHRIFKKTGQPTKIAPIHVWLGRIVIPLGIANGFTGFPLALSPGYDFALLGVVAFVLPAFFFILLVKKIFKKLMQKAKQPEETNGYDMEPWRGSQPGMQQSVAQGGGYPNTPTQSGGQPQDTRQFV